MAIYTPITSARFWSKVDVTSDEECWLWKGGTNAPDRGGYGRFRLPGNRDTVSAHRLAWELFNNEPLAGRLACHTCDTPKCCNPHHLYAGDRASNAADAVARGLTGGRDQSGAKNANAKLTPVDVDAIKSRIADGETNVQIAKDYPVTHAMISKIRTGKFWRSQKDSNLRPSPSEGDTLSS